MHPFLPSGVVERAQAGDREALALLWRDLNPLLLRYLRGRVGAHAEDIAAETWLKATRGLVSFRGDEAAFRRWVFTIGRNCLLDDIRHQTRRPEQLRAELDDETRDDAGFGDVDDLDRALALVRRLPRHQADAVLLRVVGDFDVAQVAEIMGRSEGSVRVLVHRGLRALQAILEADVTDPTRTTLFREQ